MGTVRRAQPIPAVSEAKATAEYHTQELVASAGRTVRGAKPENKLRVFEMQAKDLFGHAREGTADQIKIADGLQ